MSVFTEAFLKAFKPLSKLTGSEWADVYRYVAPGTSPEPGEWRTSRVPYLREPMDSMTDRKTEIVVMCCSSQVGKALALDTPLPTPNGWTTMGGVKVGDKVFDEQGKPCKVLAKTDVMENHKCYKVVFSDGSEIIADAEHNWYVECYYMPLEYTRGKNNAIKGIREGVISTERICEIHKQVKSKTGERNNFAIPIAKPLQTSEKELPIKPYTLGVWLGDGHSYSNQFFGHYNDFQIVEEVRKDGYRVDVTTPNKHDDNYNAIIDPKIDDGMCKRGHILSKVGITKYGHCAECARQYAMAYKWKDKSRLDQIVKDESFYTKLKKLGVLENKHIPDMYLRSSIEQRFALIQGLMDTDGSVTKKGLCEITLKNKKLVEGLFELLCSVGVKPTIHEKIATCNNYKCVVYRITFVAYSHQKIFRLKRKQERLKDISNGRSTETLRRRILDVIPVDSVPVQCIAVNSPSHLYLAGRTMIPTHNSEALLNVMGYYVDQEPAPQLMLQPTLEAAESFSKERIDPTFRFSPGLKNKLEEGKDGRGTSRKSSTTIRMKHYPGGYLALVGANSPAGLASRPIRVLLCDEIDRYTATKEGDPLKLAIQRTTNFHNRKIVMVSTPTIKGVSPIENWFMRSDKRQYFIPCPHCGKESVWKWENVKWDKDEEGNALPMTARLICPECGEVIRGAYKPNPELLEKGRWKATDSESRIKGYHINSLYSPWVNLYSLVEEFTTANKNRDKSGLMEFINLKLGEAWDERNGEEDIWQHLHLRREYYESENILPDGVLLLTAGVDVQHDRLECTIYGWGIGKECWGIEHRIIFGSPDANETWQQLDGLFQKQRLLKNGSPLNIACACVDSGDGSFTSYVYRYTKARERMRVFSIKGRGGFGIPFINSPTRGNTEGATLFSLGVDSGKSLVMSRLRIEDEGPGYVHYPRKAECGFNEEFFQQLTAEICEHKFEKGAIKRNWIKIRERNEALDCAVYATAACEILNPNFEYLKDFYENNKVEVKQRRTRGTLSSGVTL
jgi:phage terminase large subunit GpA-like protein